VAAVGAAQRATKACGLSKTLYYLVEFSVLIEDKVNNLHNPIHPKLKDLPAYYSAMDAACPLCINILAFLTQQGNYLVSFRCARVECPPLGLFSGYVLL